MIASTGSAETRAVNAQTFGFGAMVIGFWAVRFAYDRSKAYKDARAVFVVFCILQRSALACYLGSLTSRLHVRGSHVAWACGLMVVTWCTWRILQKTNIISEKDTMVLKPCMIPCRTTHSRLLPTKHSFSYSYLYVGIPVGWAGQVGTILSADSDLDKLNTRKTWFSVAAEDYLERGVHELGFKGKLQDYLKTQGISPDVYPYAYLVTAPRFLGFSFNPVSFWYLYDSKRSLAAMILEVNNTFDERRMYFMERRADSEESKDLGVKFAQEWPKDFHVSPFNDRGGAYSVQSTDPFAPSIDDLYKVDNNIVLKSEDGKPKLVARVFSTEPGIDARTMTTWETFVFVLRWWWVGFMTNPRILKEARTLWAKKLQVYYRPEVLSSSIGRKETPDEIKLEVFFRDLLHQLAVVARSTFHYTAAAGPTRAKQIVIHSTRANEEITSCPEIEIHVLTPAFYSQVVRHGSLVEAFDRYCFRPANGEAMVHCTHHELLTEALTRFSTSLRSGTASTVDWHIITRSGQYPILQLLWQTVMMVLRSYGSSGCQMKPSDFDLGVLRSSSRLIIRPYYNIALKLLLADRTAFGWMPILKFEETCVWSLLVLAAASASGEVLAGSQVPRRIVPALLKLCGIHIWSAVITAA
jgi:DUF1365 family protein